MNIPEEKLASLNYSSDADYMRTPAKFGGGIEAAVEVFHQMHCLVSSGDFVSPSVQVILLLMLIYQPHIHLTVMHHPKTLSLPLVFPPTFPLIFQRT